MSLRWHDVSRFYSPLTWVKRALVVVAAVGVLATAPARAENPITIGFGMALTGGLAPNGKAALLAMQIWEAETNAKGGLLGRKVKLVYYDDQSNPTTVPGIYTKLLDVDKVDLVVSGYGTNMIAPAMPIVMQHDRIFLGLFGLAVNNEFHYPKYFAMIPSGGPRPKQAFTEGFFATAMAQDPKPKTIAITGANAEFPRNALDGARALANQAGLTVVYDKTYPPATTDYTPIVRAIQAQNPDLVLVCSYPPDTVGMIRAAREVRLKAKLFGGCMVGLQSTAIKVQLGSLMNGIVNYDYWFPWASFASDEAREFLKAYQAKAGAAGVDPLGYYLPPFAYAEMQLLKQAIDGTKSLDQNRLADYLSNHTFHTVVGDIKFGPDGEWAEPRVLEVQFQGVESDDIEQFKDPKTEVILWPAQYRTGNFVDPSAYTKP